MYKNSTVRVYRAKSKYDLLRLLSELEGISRLLHDILRFFISFIEQLFFIFNQMFSIGSFGRHAKPIIYMYLLWVIEITCSVQLNMIKTLYPGDMACRSFVLMLYLEDNGIC